MKRIYLHAGTHKTGTTSFQQAMREHAAWLAEKRVFFPSVGELYGSRIGGLHSIPREMRDGSLGPGVRGLGDFLAAFEASGLDAALISSEGFSLLDDAQLGAFAERVSGYSVRPVMAFRHPIAFISSTYCSAGAFKLLRPLDRYLISAASQRRVQYGNIASRWTTTFPETVFLQYETHPSIEKPLLSLMGLPELEMRTEPRRISLPLPLAMLNFELYTNFKGMDKAYRDGIYDRLFEFAATEEYRDLVGDLRFVPGSAEQQMAVLDILRPQMKKLACCVPWNVDGFTKPLSGTVPSGELLLALGGAFRKYKG
jgi:hypothetical protein